ncbi:MAG TPA: helix-turn-helix transcriptional regulator [Usitatibacter sp.]|nr:helix-turn-helix transcriptional regulator [Usitatibacter sp.]
MTSAFRGMVDSMRAPLLLLHPNRVLLHANAPAVRILERADCIYRFKGQLACVDEDSQQLLDRELRHVNGGDMNRAIVTLRTTSGAVMPGALTGLYQSHKLAERHRTDILLLAVADREASTTDARELCRVFNLTPAEARIAREIGEGRTPQECADMLQVKVSTVRTHLVSIYRKTGTGSQVHLARLILPLSIF